VISFHVFYFTNISEWFQFRCPGTTWDRQSRALDPKSNNFLLWTVSSRSKKISLQKNRRFNLPEGSFKLLGNLPLVRVKPHCSIWNCTFTKWHASNCHMNGLIIQCSSPLLLSFWTQALPRVINFCFQNQFVLSSSYENEIQLWIEQIQCKKRTIGLYIGVPKKNRCNCSFASLNRN